MKETRNPRDLPRMCTEIGEEYGKMCEAVNEYEDLVQILEKAMSLHGVTGDAVSMLEDMVAKKRGNK